MKHIVYGDQSLFGEHRQQRYVDMWRPKHIASGYFHRNEQLLFDRIDGMVVWDDFGIFEVVMYLLLIAQKDEVVLFRNRLNHILKIGAYS